MNQSTLLLIGIIVLFLGILIIVVSMFFPQKSTNVGANMTDKTSEKSKSGFQIEKPKVAFVGFLGPIPFGFGNDSKLLKIALIIGFVLILILWLMRFRV